MGGTRGGRGAPPRKGPVGAAHAPAPCCCSSDRARSRTDVRASGTGAAAAGSGPSAMGAAPWRAGGRAAGPLEGDPGGCQLGPDPTEGVGLPSPREVAVR